MYEQDLIEHLRQYFLEHTDKAQRQEYANSLPEETRKTLVDFEDSFIRDGVDSDGVLRLLRRHQLTSFNKEVNEIQTNFYLNVNERADRQPQVDDHTALIDARNSSYLFLTDDGFENDLETILKFKDRDAIREKVKSFEQQRVASENSGQKAKSPFVIIRPLLRYASLAVAASLVLIIWQPFHEGDRDLFNNYISTSEQIEFPESDSRVYYDRERIDGGSRGTKDIPLQNLSEIEKTKASEALSLYINKSYKASAQAFSDLGISPVKGHQFLIYLAISQLHINDLEKAKNNLLSVLASKDTTQHDSALFYLGLYYLKTENRDEARQRLEILADKPGKYQNEAQAILPKMRWF